MSGGYFADPGYKDVPGSREIGYPIAEVARRRLDGRSPRPTEQAASSPRTVKEQMLYEMHDPSAYLVPDVTLDITGGRGRGRGRAGPRPGHRRPWTAATADAQGDVSAEHGYLAEGEMSYSGTDALARAELAAACCGPAAHHGPRRLPVRID